MIHSYSIFVAGSFGRRASDGGANLQIYYPTSSNSVQAIDPVYGNVAASKDLRIGADVVGQTTHLENIPASLECGDEPNNDEIQR